MAAKREYDIDGRTFHVEKQAEGGWAGWFVDDPDSKIVEELKMDVLCAAGYEIPSPGGIVIQFGGKERKYAKPRTMDDAYQELRERIANGKKPKVPAREKPIHKFVIFGRDDCVCIYCGIIPKTSHDIRVDHVVPVSAGGKHIAGNVVTTCRDCNASKGSKRLENEAEILDKISGRNRIYGIDNDHRIDLPDRVQ